MNKFFVILNESTLEYKPKKGENKGKELTKKIYTVATSVPSNYLLNRYTDADESDYDEFVDGKYYKQHGTSLNFGSLEHLFNRYLKQLDEEPSEDILTVQQLIKRLNEQYLSKQDFLDTWLPKINVKEEVVKKPLDY